MANLKGGSAINGLQILSKSGSDNYIPKFSNDNALLNSLISDNGTKITINGGIDVSGIASIPSIEMHDSLNSGWVNQFRWFTKAGELGHIMLNARDANGLNDVLTIVPGYAGSASKVMQINGGLKVVGQNIASYTAGSNQVLKLSGGQSVGGQNKILFTNPAWTDNDNAGMASIRINDTGSYGGELIFSTVANNSGANGVPTDRFKIQHDGAIMNFGDSWVKKPAPRYVFQRTDTTNQHAGITVYEIDGSASPNSNLVYDYNTDVWGIWQNGTTQTLWHNGNVSSGSITNVLGYTPFNQAGGNFTGAIRVAPTINSISTGSGNTFEIQATSGASHAAYMLFHRPGAFAYYFGMDTNNVLSIGGFSMGNVSYMVHTAAYENVAPASASYGSRIIRNTILSTGGPSGGANGDIWMQYV